MPAGADPWGFAMAAVDVALWDLKGNRLGTPLWRLLGGANPSVRAYAGNIDLNFPMNRLLEGGMASVEQGFRSVKMRLGRPTIAEDIARVEAMRNHLPDDIEMMADANEAWRVDQAMRAMTLLEPLRPRLAGGAHRARQYRRLRPICARSARCRWQRARTTTRSRSLRP